MADPRLPPSPFQALVAGRAATPLPVPLPVPFDPRQLLPPADVATPPLPQSFRPNPYRPPGPTQPPLPTNPLAIVGTPSATSAAGMGALLDRPGDLRAAGRAALAEAQRAPFARSVTDLASPSGEYRARGIEPPGPLASLALDLGADPLNLVGDPFTDIGKLSALGVTRAPELYNAARRFLTGVSSRAAEHLALAPIERTAAGRLLVSTRLPGGETPQVPPPGSGILTTTLADASADPGFIRKLAEQVRDYPLIRPRERRYNDRGVLDVFAERGAENLDALIEWQDPDVQLRAGGWYVGAHRIGDRDIATAYHQPLNASIGLLATQSPGTEWPINIEVAKRLARYYEEFTRTDPAFERHLFDQFASKKLASTEAKIIEKKLSPERAAKLQAGAAADIAASRPYIDYRWSDLPDLQRGQMIRAFSELNEAQTFPLYSPEGDIVVPVAKTQEGKNRGLKWQSYENMEAGLSMLRNPTDANISLQLGKGHKVRSFFNNLSVPSDPRSTTADVHKITGTHLRPLGGSAPEVRSVTGGTPENISIGIKGAYPLFYEASARAAGARGLVPNQGQSIAWEGAKGLFSPSDRRYADFGKDVSRIWDEYHRGKIPQREAQWRIHLLARGIERPEWASYPVSPVGLVPAAK